MPIRLYNTLTKSKDLFVPLDEKNVRMYVCGPTVYDFAHIGNARPAIVFDLLYRLLKHEYERDGGKVTYVRNITDVDDKINERALRDFPGLPLNEAIRNVTEKTEAQYHADVAALGCLPPTHEPRATAFIPGMVSMIGQLITRGHAYTAAGEVLFDTQSMPDYGKLSGRKLDEQQAGARIAVDAHKKHANDFVLWKLSADNEPGWESPWGRGRPGWHIECSAMSAHHLGQTFDIHGGGLDLIFPHHENEIAQSRCAHGTPVMANVWMHNGFLQVEGEKMSKSLGNFFTIRELLQGKKFGGRAWHGGVLKLAMLKTHYRKPIDWTLDQLVRSRYDMAKFAFAASTLGAHKRLKFEAAEGHVRSPDGRVISALANDLDTSLVISLLHEMAEEARGNFEAAMNFAKTVEFLGLMDEKTLATYSTVGPVTDIALGNLLRQHDDMVLVENVRVALANGDFQTVESAMGVAKGWGVELKFDTFNEVTFEADTAAESASLTLDVEAAIEARKAARAAKNFAESDRIRDELLSKGIVLKDGPEGTTWEVKR